MVDLEIPIQGTQINDRSPTACHLGENRNRETPGEEQLPPPFSVTEMHRHCVMLRCDEVHDSLEKIVEQETKEAC